MECRLWRTEGGDMFLQQFQIYFEDNFILGLFEIVGGSYKPLLLTLLLVIPLYIVFSPMNWIYELSDTGWKKASDCQRNIQQRKVGNVPPVFPNGWFALAESNQIKPLEVIRVVALGENFAVFRSERGKVEILDGYCPHLGANMAVGGKVRGDCLECPFHLWRFSGETGACSYIPNTTQVPKSAKVKKWLSHECNDFIFVWYHAEDEEPSWYPMQEVEYSYIGRNQFEVNCHIQEIPENGSDPTHFTALHGASAVSGGDVGRHETGFCARWVRHEWSSHWEANQHLGFATISHNIAIGGLIRFAYCQINVQQMGPGFVVLRFTTSLGPIILLQTVTPSQPLIQTVRHRIYSPRYLVLYSKFILLAESFMFKRDVMIWNNKTYLDKPLLTKDDSSIARYRKWFSQFYSAHSPTYTSSCQQYQW